MLCSFSEIRNKEVVNVKTGLKIGYVDDVQMDTDSGNVVSFVVYGRPRAFGIMGRDDDIVIKCNNIKLIGQDTILVNFDNDTICTKNRKSIVENL